MAGKLEIVYGWHSVRAVVLTRPEAVRRAIVLKGKEEAAGRNTSWTERYLALMRPTGVTPQVLPWQEFMRVTGLKDSDRHQGICLFVEPRRLHDESDLGELADAHLVVAVDQVSNPQNLATILRTAAFFGTDALLLVREHGADMTPEVVRMASGGAEFVKIYRVTNLRRALQAVKDLGFWIYGLDERGQHATGSTDFHERTVLVVGAEGGGLRRLTRESCDFLVRIPGGAEGIESLNAAVAASIALADIRRSRPSPAGGERQPT
jgi:23S rRNA (guanosine2251-2'-O)-methyltransferase